MTRRVLLGFVAAVLLNVTAFAQGGSTVFLVRHAERADTAAGMKAAPGSDPSLSDVGHRRAQALAIALKDARISAIFVTEYKRTEETAMPLATALGLTPIRVTSKDLPGLVAKIKQASGNVLVVGHSNSVPETIKALGVPTPVAIADTEFDHLFIVTPQLQLIQLRYR
jgi:broad specificity phosphatase PhoE